MPGWTGLPHDDRQPAAGIAIAIAIGEALARTRVLNDDLAVGFARWHHGFTHQNEPVELRA